MAADPRRRRAAIIGTGLIGQAWAIVFARQGWQVRLWGKRGGLLPGAGVVHTVVAARG